MYRYRTQKILDLALAKDQKTTLENNLGLSSSPHADHTHDNNNDEDGCIQNNICMISNNEDPTIITVPTKSSEFIKSSFESVEKCDFNAEENFLLTTFVDERFFVPLQSVQDESSSMLLTDEVSPDGKENSLVTTFADERIFIPLQNVQNESSSILLTDEISPELEVPISIENVTPEGLEYVETYSDDSLADPNYEIAKNSRNFSSEGGEETNTDKSEIAAKRQRKKRGNKRAIVEEILEEGATEEIKRTKKKRLRRDLDKLKRDKSSHIMRSPCRCKGHCISKITEARRNSIWEDYYKMNYNARRAWVYSKIIQNEKKRKITKATLSKRTKTLTYNLPDENGISKVVCKAFFLKTLGYHEKNDKIITTVLRNTPLGSITPKADSRGRHEPSNKLNREILKEHVMKYNPCVSHYRREHAPHRLYLPSDVKIKDMLEDYNEHHPNQSVSYETYRKVVTDELKISFTKLGNEECDYCVIQDQHLKFHLRGEENNDIPTLEIGLANENDENLEEPEVSNNNEDDGNQKQTENNNENSEKHEVTDDNNKNTELSAMKTRCENSKKNQNCNICKKFLEHATKAKISRDQYRQDVAESSTNEGISFRSVDLQKVIMLPRIPGSKKTCFTKRIVAFHQTFALMMGDQKKKTVKKNISVLWHEALAGRKAEEITSCYHKALMEERDALHFVYWVDNCSGQNKNWILFTALVTLVNSNQIAAKDITLKYFEAGHTFMSADSVHHGVELSMKYMGNIYDFNDFINAVQNSNAKKMKVVCLDNEDVLDWKAGDSKSKKINRPLLCDISVIQFRRNSRNMFYKNSLTDNIFQECNFLKKKLELKIPEKLRAGPRGIQVDKKKGILSELGPLMPENRKFFWTNLREADVNDLITTDV